MHFKEEIQFFLQTLCLGLLLVIVIKHWPKAIWGGKGLFLLIGYSSPLRKAKAETGVEARGVRLTDLLFMPCSACFL